MSFHLLHTRLFNIMLHLAFTFESLPLYNSSSPSTNTFTLFSMPAFLISFSVLFFHLILPSPPGAALSFSHTELCYTEIFWERDSGWTKNENHNQSLPPGSMSHFFAREYMTILPLCDWRTSGTEWQSGGQKKSHSRSRCLLPLDICPWDGTGRMGNGGEGREYYREEKTGGGGS